MDIDIVCAPAHEEIVGQVGHADIILCEGARRVGVHVVRHDECLGALRNKRGVLSAFVFVFVFLVAFRVNPS